MTLPKATHERIAQEAKEYLAAFEYKIGDFSPEEKYCCRKDYTAGATAEAERTLRAEERAEKLRAAIKAAISEWETDWKCGTCRNVNRDCFVALDKALADDAEAVGRETSHG